jgi:23S rRNA (guanine2445-N2)-methyltransferase / 23S rRNA (guanine2069-N7)-methyltransferase
MLCPSMAGIDLIATAGFGLEAVVARELQALGYTTQTLGVGRVLFTGDERAICRANLHLRTAGRVFVRMGCFTATDFGVLFDQTRDLPWEQWIAPEAEFPVNGRSVKSQLSSVPACQSVVKKAIVERLRTAHGVDELPETGARCVVEVSLLKDEVTLTLDTTGAGLHRRGYRKLSGEAPLRETLAASLVQLSFWKPDRPLIDPFCGTGTIVVEAAMAGRNIAPGLRREFAAEQWARVPASLWREEREKAAAAVLPELPLRIEAYDKSDEALSLARYHARQAGVENDIHFQQRDFADLSSKREYGCIITNPPYGQRISDEAELAALYESMPLVLRRLPTWSHFIFTAYPDFEKLIGQPADRRRKLYNGRIECTYYQFHGPPPGKQAREKAEEAAPLEPVFGGLPAGSERQAEEFANRLAKRARHLRRWPTRQGITCYRLYERDVPDVPLVVDRYEDHLHIGEFERPNEHTPAQHEEWMELMRRTAAEALEVDVKKVFMKFRRRQRGLTQHEAFDSSAYTLEVGEGGLRFIVNLSDYVDTGLFLDHRNTRAMVREQAAGKRMLNLFCYTGSFSVYAAAGGAASTTSVDLSNTYLDWAAENLRLNGFEGPGHRLIRADAARWVLDHPRGEHYDLAVIDPPTFSNSKMADGDWDVQRHHAMLLNATAKLMPAGGVIYFSTNFRRFKLDEAALEQLAVREISKQTVPEDFRNERIHRCWRLIVQ